jgi:3-hydroxyacyl-CoA dehydrogenase/enoyl-CoA hydratase/3-hydroxybutyryl-CoA epimerase
MSIQEAFKVIPQTLAGSSIAIVEFDLVGEKVNKWNTQTMTRFREVVQELAKSSYKLVIFRSGKPKTFIAGADIEEIRSLTTKEAVAKAVGAGHEIFNMVEDLPMPTMASIHGACMGGGCEFIMSCDYRIASDAPETRIGLPETKLGIIPGFGGCVRMPRIIGLQNALDIILQGKAVSGKKATKMGLVDRAVHPSILPEQTLRYAEEILKGGGKKCKKQFHAHGAVPVILESFLGRTVVFAQARKSVMKLTHGHYPAQLKAIDVIEKTYGMSDRSKAMQVEADAFCELGITEVSKNLIHVFFLTEMVKKQKGVASADVKAHDVQHLGILGAGTMGGGIAYVAADKGIDVRMKDVNMAAVGKGIKHARDLWQKLVKRKAITEYDLRQKIALVNGGVDYSGFRQMDVVIEAIVEDLEVKKKVIAETAAQMRPDAIIATNTSSLSVSEIAHGHPKPEFFAGMHFFNPVNKMPLVEVIRGLQTSDETVATIFELSKKMGKIPVVVKDSPGFLVNRLLLPYMAEAAFLLQEGMDIDRVDKAYVKEFGMPMGPFALMDEVGLDVCQKVLKIFKKAFGARIEISPTMDKLEKSGRMGKKNSKGFYTYDTQSKRLSVDPKIYSDLGLPAPTNPLPIKECLERGIFAMINECSLALIEDRIVESADEVDLAMIMGTGFPPFRGGLLKYADSIGTKYICDQLEIYSSKGAARLKPATPLRNLAKNNSKFYKN